MGQQQLLLVILVTIIVGIATVVAINIFGTAADQANRDAVRQDLMGAAVQAQAIWSRPQLMGGADRNFQGAWIDDNEITQRLSIPGTITTNTVSNENGVYTVTATGQAVLQVSAAPSSSPSDLMIMDVTFQPACSAWLIEIDDQATGQTSESGRCAAAPTNPD